MRGRELLPDLYAAAVPVHVAKAADIHKNVKAEALPGGECTQQFIMLAAMSSQADVNDLLSALRTHAFDV